MIYTAFFLTLGFVLGMVFHQRMVWIVALGFFVRTLVPVQAVGPIFFKLNPGASIIVGAFVAFFVFRTHEFREWASRYSVTLIVALGLAGYMCLDVLNGGGVSSTLGVAMQLLGIPLIIMLLAGREIALKPSRQLILAWVIIGSAVVQVVLSQMQLNAKNVIWWTSVYADSWWFDPTQKLTRAMGTTGHPLQLGLLMACATPLLLLVKYTWLRLTLIPVMIYGTIEGNARTALAIVIATGVIVVLDSLRRSPVQTLAVTPVAALVFSAVLSRNHALVEDLTKKFSNDAGSTEKRRAAATWFFEHEQYYRLLGYSGARDLRGAGVLTSSLENGYFKAALEFGILFSVLYALYMVSMVLWPFVQSRRTFPWALAGVGILIGFASTGSFMDGAVEGTTLWVIVAAATGVGMHERDRTKSARAVEEALAAKQAAQLPRWKQAARGW